MQRLVSWPVVLLLALGGLPSASGITPDGSRWPINLGLTGVRAHLKPDAPTTLVVAEVLPGSPAAGKIQVGDRIVGVNGRPFRVPHRFGYGMKVFGYEGPMMDVGNALEESQGPARRGGFSFLVGEASQPRAVTLRLPAKYGRFAPGFPFDCRKTDLILSELLAWLIQHQRPDGSWAGRPHLNTFATLALLASGDPRHMPAVTRAVRMMAAKTGPKMDPTGLPNWQYTLYGIALAEYHLATGEAWVLPELDEIRIALEDSQLMPGEPGKQRHGGWGHRPGYEGYGPIGVITAQGLAAFGLMRQAGLAVNPANYREAAAFLARGTNNIGYVWYADDGANNANNYADMGRTGISAIAHAVGQSEGQAFGEIAVRNARCIGEHPQTFIDTHGSPILGIGWTAVGAAIWPDAYRRLMDEHVWFFNLAQNPDGSFSYLPNRDSNDQDYGPGNDLPGTAAVALTLAVKYKSLRIMGARVFIEGVDPSRLSGQSARAFELIGQGRYATAHRLLSKARTTSAGVSGPAGDAASDADPVGPMLAYIDDRLAAALDHIRQLDEQDRVVPLERAIEGYRADWGGLPAFDEAVAPLQASLTAEPRRTSLRLGKALARLLERAEAQPTAASLRPLEKFAELHADHPAGQEARRAVEALEASSPEARDRYFESLREQLGL